MQRHRLGCTFSGFLGGALGFAGLVSLVGFFFQPGVGASDVVLHHDWAFPAIITTKGRRDAGDHPLYPHSAQFAGFARTLRIAAASGEASPGLKWY